MITDSRKRVFKNVTREYGRKHGDLGIDKQYRHYVFHESMGHWDKYVPKTKKNPNARHILRTINNSNTWLTVHDFDMNPIHARNTLEHLHNERRICKGPDDTYGNYDLFIQWKNKN